jgi:hypothetical protein
MCAVVSRGMLAILLTLSTFAFPSPRSSTLGAPPRSALVLKKLAFRPRGRTRSASPVAIKSAENVVGLDDGPARLQRVDHSRSSRVEIATLSNRASLLLDIFGFQQMLAPLRC